MAATLGQKPFRMQTVGTEKVVGGHYEREVVAAHRWRRRLGLRCLTVRVSDRTVRHLISTGYLSLESIEATPAVAIALEAWIYDNVP
jgi:hypothetical protein